MPEEELSVVGAWSEADLAAAARQDLGEDEKRLKEDLAALRRWISKSPHLHSIKQDEEYLTMFLRGCKFSLERTKEKLDFHHAVRGGLPSWFADWDPRLPAVQAILKAGMFLPLPGYDRQGRKVVLMRGGLGDPNTMKKDDEFKASTMVIPLCCTPTLVCTALRR